MNSDICNDCKDNVNDSCTITCEKLFNYLYRHLIKIKETGGCPRCNNKKGYLLMPLSRDPILEVYCDDCGITLCVDYQPEEYIIDSTIIDYEEHEDEDEENNFKERMGEALSFKKIGEILYRDAIYSSFEEYNRG